LTYYKKIVATMSHVVPQRPNKTRQIKETL
jgi:hypothetical protein